MLTAEGITDIGLCRDTNQDAYDIIKLPGGAVAVILCDGMGGENGGNVASDLSVKTIAAQLRRGYHPALGEASLRGLLLSAVSVANALVHDRAKRDEALSGMGTTAEVVLARGRTACIAHVGDSSVFSLSPNGEGSPLEGKIEKLTCDHTRVQQLLDQGVITAQEADNHPERHYIVRAVGVASAVNPDYDQFTLPEGGGLLICSDGLTNHVEPQEICRILLPAIRSGELGNGVQKLVEAANRFGGADNITAVVIADQAEGEARSNG